MSRKNKTEAVATETPASTEPLSLRAKYSKEDIAKVKALIMEGITNQEIVRQMPHIKAGAIRRARRAIKFANSV